MPERAGVVICGAGIAGVAAAYHLAARRGVPGVLLVDERAPLSLTSDRSTECYRNWWPGPDGAMVRLMNRSVDLLEALARETGNTFHLNRRGYVYATADPARAARLESAAARAEAQGAGPLRRHAGHSGEPPYRPAPPSGFEGQPGGADLLLEPRLVRRHFPYLSERVVAVLHARRCGWLSAQQLGVCLLERARAAGARLLRARVEGIGTQGGRARSVRVRDVGGPREIETEAFVNAAGPMLKEVGRLAGADLPVIAEAHARIAFRDDLGALPRDAPLLIWSDPVTLPWPEEERELLAEAEQTRRLLDAFPPGAHARPEGGAAGATLLMLWACDPAPVEPVWPVKIDPFYPEIVLRGLSVMLPGLRAYCGRSARPAVDGGYYVKTRDNRPLIGPLPIPGTYALGALSGFGIMAACAAGELLAAHVTGGALPDYAPAFIPARLADPDLADTGDRREEWQL